MNAAITNEKIGVIGLGYVGLPLAIEFAKKFEVVGFDNNAERIADLKKGKDTNQEIDASNFENLQLEFTNHLADLKACTTYIITVPTPIDEHKNPDLEKLLQATTLVAGLLTRGDLVVYESTVYPGCTDEECIPLLEGLSNLKCDKDFSVGYSPERVNAGDKEHLVQNTVKVVSGSNSKALDKVKKIYSEIVTAGVHPVSSIRVAEAAKIIENTQRDLNIALMNELSIIFNRMNLDTYEVIEAASTKWNFNKFSPGLVGGHCIGVDPYYLTYKAKEVGYHPQVILSGRFVNDSMGFYTAKQTIKQLIKLGKNLQTCKILILGATFKEDVADIRNTKNVNIYSELKSYGVHVDITDPHACNENFEKEYGITLLKKPDDNYDAVIVATIHKEYLELKEKDFKKMMNPSGILIDVKGAYRGKIKEIEYWSL
ncbi:MAG: UDP-N-acetyl-D-galactosamine dehydrogenase [Salibacteraceae bacterium]|jgi:UDP-N-acetyl-D-galactosamine dehydrogenase